MKTHLIQSDEPLRGKGDREALCGKIVPQPVFVWAFDSDAAPQFLDAMPTVNKCHKCELVPLTKRYVYGIVAGESVLHPEDN